MARFFILQAIFIVVFFQGQIFAQTQKTNPPLATQEIATSVLKSEIKDFLAQEIGAHFAAINALDPPPDWVFGALTVGEFSWGSFMRALAAQAELSGSHVIAGKDTARAIAEMGLIEEHHGGKSFAQLFAALALRHYGTDLIKNAVWQSLTESEKKEWSNLLDATRIYNPSTRRMINLPDNYFGVASRIAALSYQMGILKDRAFLDSLLDRAAEQFADGGLYADDNPPTGRYDRYSNEYARFCWDAAGIAGRTDIQEKLKPSLKEQMKLWWDVVSDQGYGYNWGRSQGLVSYLDTLEITAFLGEHPEFRPAPLADLASVYQLAWRWLRRDYADQAHMFRVLDFGRGNYSYISLDREWEQTATAFGKIVLAHDSFMKTLERENLAQIPASPKLPDVARFEFFAKTKDKQGGVWVVRQGSLRFALPIVTGTKPAVADYLAAPFGLAGFAAPVEEVYPALVPFIELEDGKTYAASEGADLIEPSEDGQSLRVLWHKWGQIGSKASERFDIGITSEVRWHIEGNKLVREETLAAASDVSIKRWWVAVPTTADTYRTEINGKNRVDVFTGREGRISVTSAADWPYETILQATGDSRIGKGVLGAIPLHLIYSTSDLKLPANQPKHWKLVLEVELKKAQQD